MGGGGKGGGVVLRAPPLHNEVYLMLSTSTEAGCDNFFLCIFCSTTPYKDTDPTSAENRIDDIQEIEKLKVLLVASEYTLVLVNVATVGFGYIFSTLVTSDMFFRSVRHGGLQIFPRLLLGYSVTCSQHLTLLPFYGAWHRIQIYPRLALITYFSRVMLAIFCFLALGAVAGFSRDWQFRLASETCAICHCSNWIHLLKNELFPISTLIWKLRL